MAAESALPKQGRLCAASSLCASFLIYTLLPIDPRCAARKFNNELAATRQEATQKKVHALAKLVYWLDGDQIRKCNISKCRKRIF